jgi:predicted nucleotidyltransferase
MTAPAGLELALGHYQEALRSHYGSRLRSIYLFGSRARGHARADSDVDVAVILDEFGDDRWAEMRTLDGLGFELEIETGLVLHAWPVTTGEWTDPAGSTARRLVEGMQRDARLLAAPR